MGTFNLKIDAIANQTGAWRTTPGGLTTDAAIIAAINNNNAEAILVNAGAPPQATGIIGFNCGWFLDGSVVETPFASLPAGFTVLTARLELRVALATNVDVNYATDTVIMFFANGLESRDISNTAPDLNTGPSNRWYYYDHPATGLTALHLETDVPGISYLRPTNPGINSFPYLVITGTYDIATYTDTWVINTPDPVQVGDSINMTGDDGLDNIDSILLSYNDGSPQEIVVTIFTLQTPTEVEFDLPAGLGDFIGTVDVYVNVTAPEFTGQAFIAPLEVIIADASGIYTIVTNKRSDTVYTSHTTGETTEIAIPNPFYKTGFVG